MSASGNEMPAQRERDEKRVEERGSRIRAARQNEGHDGDLLIATMQDDERLLNGNSDDGAG